MSKVTAEHILAGLEQIHQFCHGMRFRHDCCHNRPKPDDCEMRFKPGHCPECSEFRATESTVTFDTVTGRPNRLLDTSEVLRIFCYCDGYLDDTRKARKEFEESADKSDPPEPPE